MKIRNKQTGEIIDVPENELGKYGITAVQNTQAPAPQQSPIQTPQQQPTQPNAPMEITPEMVMQAQLRLSPKDAAKIESMYNIQRQAKMDAIDMAKAGEKSAEQLKQEQQEKSGRGLREEAISTIDKILGKDTGGMTGTMQWGAKVPFLATDTKATLGEYDKLSSLLSLDNIKYLKGTGQISDREGMILERAALSIPKDRKISDEDFRRVLEETRVKLSEEMGEEVPRGQEVYKKPTAQDTVNNMVSDKGRNPLINFLLGGSLDTVNDLARGEEIRQGGGAALEDNLKTAQDIIQQIDSTDDPKKKELLKQQADNLLNSVIEQSGEAVDSFSDRNDVNPLLRGLEVGSEVTSLAGLPSLLKNLLAKGGTVLGAKSGKEAISTIARGGGDDIAQKTVNVLDTAKKYTPKAILGRKQAEAATKAVTDVNFADELAKSVSKTASADADVAKQLVKEKGVLDTIKDVPTLLERMSYWGRNAYSAGGDIKATAKANLYKDLYSGGLEILKTEAPEVYKYRRLLAYTHELPTSAAKALWRVFLGSSVIRGMK